MAGLVLAEMRGDDRWRPLAVAGDREHLRGEPIGGLPELALDEALERHPPASCALLVTIGYGRMRARAELFARAGALGYRMPPYVALRARVHADAVIGAGAIVFDDAYVGPGAELGEQVVLRPQAYVGHGARVGAHSFLTTRSLIGGGAWIGALSFVGLGAIVRDHVEVGEECLIGAGALVIADLAPCGVYVGQPARRVGDHGATGIELER
jgi:sugar O-acyltransferase (sialic acid O-acetyltransferase NeuD family)